MSRKLPSNAVWLVTGCSSGIGAALARHIILHGHSLVATARNPTSLSNLEDSPRVLKLKLDVSSSSEISSVFTKAVTHFGRIDVLVNNAGYGIHGDFEAIPDKEARQIMETNFWGSVNATREALRVFREVNPKGEGGTIIQVSSVGGYIGWPGSAFYNSTKFALEGLTESVSKEMPSEWNIKFLIVEPGGVKTNYMGSSMVDIAPLPAYEDPNLPGRRLDAYRNNPDLQKNFADPDAVARTIFDVVSLQGERPMPLRLPLGSDAFGLIKNDTEAELKSLVAWEDVIISTSTMEQMESVEFLRRK